MHIAKDWYRNWNKWSGKLGVLTVRWSHWCLGIHWTSIATSCVRGRAGCIRRRWGRLQSAYARRRAALAARCATSDSSGGSRVTLGGDTSPSEWLWELLFSVTEKNTRLRIINYLNELWWVHYTGISLTLASVVPMKVRCGSYGSTTGFSMRGQVLAQHCTRPMCWSPCELCHNPTAIRVYNTWQRNEQLNISTYAWFNANKEVGIIY